MKASNIKLAICATVLLPVILLGSFYFSVWLAGSILNITPTGVVEHLVLALLGLTLISIGCLVLSFLLQTWFSIYDYCEKYWENK